MSYIRVASKVTRVCQAVVSLVLRNGNRRKRSALIDYPHLDHELRLIRIVCSRKQEEAATMQNEREKKEEEEFNR